MATETSSDIRDFHEQLKTILPRLRIYALSLTRDRDAADDLVHDTVIKALTGRHSFQPGTNATSSSRDSVGSVRPFRSILQSPNRFPIQRIRTVAW
jgi:hypothetical protein